MSFRKNFCAFMIVAGAIVLVVYFWGIVLWLLFKLYNSASFHGKIMLLALISVIGGILFGGVHTE